MAVVTGEKEERILTINLREAYEKPRTKRLKRAIKILREKVKRFMKVEEVKISQKVNDMFLKKSIKKPPRKIKIKVIKEGNIGKVEKLE